MEFCIQQLTMDENVQSKNLILNLSHTIYYFVVMHISFKIYSQ